jgi:hypothetical protein
VLANNKSTARRSWLAKSLEGLGVLGVIREDTLSDLLGNQFDFVSIPDRFLRAGTRCSEASNERDKS